MDEQGFTIIELLVVVLIIGVLAAIALPTFLGQANRAHDQSAKSDVRNAVSQMEACFRSTERYLGCPDAEHAVAAGVIVAVTPDGMHYSASQVSATGTTFTIERQPQVFSLTCDKPGVGGCDSSGRW